MKKLPLPILIMLSGLLANAQNVGIGTTTPNFPLSFPNTLGDKISLWGTSGAHYGIGVQSLTLQIHTDIPTADIAFGYGTSASFTENMRIKGNGNVGIGTTSPANRLHIMNGSSGYSGPLNLGMTLEGNGANYMGLLTPNNAENGVLFGTVSNTANGGIIYNNPSNPNGLQFRTNGNSTRMVIDNAGRVGIGITNPNAPLSFPPTLEKKITLYPGATGDVGFGVTGNRLLIYADNPNADVAIGYDAAGTFNERFAMKPNGAFAVNGNTGTSGQILQSNGSGSAATWVTGTNPLYNNTIGVDVINFNTISNSAGVVQLSGMTYTFTVTGNTKLYITYSIPVQPVSCTFCGGTNVYIDININGGLNARALWNVGNGQSETCTYNKIIPLTAGTYTVALAASVIGPDCVFGGDPTSIFHKLMNLQIIQQ